MLSAPGSRLNETMTAIARQVYVPAQVIQVGRSGLADPDSPDPNSLDQDALPPQGVPFAGRVSRVEDVGQILDRLDDRIEFVWLIHGDTRPRPDALVALLRETRRHDGSVAGSKVLIEGSDDRLDSVGEATDVFGEPYSGLDPEELDLEQYDVVREVAFVPPISMLVRRDLLSGLGGLDSELSLDAAGLDLSQRARLAGGRVIVVPSSEVFHPLDCPDHQPGWRQQAGRQRAMLIAYRPITLAWVLPTGLLAGIADGLGQLLLGRVRPLLATLFGWVWNVGKLASTVAARRALRRVRQVGDEELFRFQVAGSVRLRKTLSELGERFSRAIDDQEPDSLAERTVHAWTKPTAILVALSSLGVAIATREIWFAGTPVAGFSLPPADNLGGLIASYGGGWHSSGLGSSVPAPPIAGLGAIVNLLVGGRPEIAATLLTVGSVVAALAGTIRLARRAGASSGAGHLAAWVYVGGATSAALFGAGQWPLLLAAGSLPWVLDSVLSPTSGDWRARLGRYARGGLTAGLAAAAYPPVLALVPVAAILWAAFTRRWFAVLTGLAVTALGLGLVAPFVAAGNLWPLLTAAPLPVVEFRWLWPVSVVAAVGVGALWIGKSRLGPLAFGGSLAVGGWLLALAPGVLAGWGMVGLLAASIGGALLTAMVVEVAEGPTWRRLVALASVALFLVPAVATAAGGRAGLPVDRWSDRLGFVNTLAEFPLSTRVLLIGPAADLPGAGRSLGPVAYRLVDAGAVTLEQAYLPNSQAGDVALAEVIVDHLILGTDLRPGAALAEFGVGWVVVLPGADFDTQALDRQIDLALTPVDPELTVYENLAPSARAMTEDGDVWDWDGQTYRGEADGRVRLADNADGRWGPDWAPDAGWANTVSGEGGEAVFAPDSTTRVAGLASGALLALLLIVVVWGIRKPTRRTSAKPRSANQPQVGEESDGVDNRYVDDGTSPIEGRS
ncbi:MAG TPA: hypothetical protein VJQ79_13205 [Acidimicrobiia bacterium]|nr:hypothetical protein [Acidimicrobiia bacterium]